MDLPSDEAPRIRVEPILPMVNLVFLLLIFVLLTAHFAALPPARVVLPQAPGATRLEAGPLRLALDREGMLVFGEASGPAALRALAAETGRRAVPVALHADRDAKAAAVARALAALAERGAAPVWLVVEDAR